MKLQSIAEILEAADQIIDNIQKDLEVQKKIAGMGFPQKRVQDGIALRQQAQTMQDTKDSHYNEQWAISRQLNQEADTAITLFKEHAKIARIAFRNEPVFLHALKIERFVRGQWHLIRQAQHFYTQLTLSATAMDAYGITQPMLEQAQASIGAVLATKRTRTRKKGVAQDSTQEKRKAFMELKAWIIEFRKVARFAFRDNPQLLESFGIVVASAVK